MKRIRVFIGLIFVIYAFSSCDTVDTEAKIPSYIQIDSVIVNTEIGQGTNYQKITDVWVNVDGKRQGTYPIPGRFPVISEGNHTVKISAGILKNGILDLRERYVFLKPYEKTVNFKPNEVLKITPEFEYYDDGSIDFWVEDFDSPGIKFHSVDSLKLLEQIEYPEGSGNKVGYVKMPDTVNVFDFYTQREMTVGRTAIYMEVEYKSNVTFGIGLRIKKKKGGFRYEEPFIHIKPKADWNKLYINLSEQFLVSPTLAKGYDVYFIIGKDDTLESTELFLDNVKILSFK